MDLTTLFKMSYGVYVVGSKFENDYSACIATTAMQVTSEGTPKLIAVINKQNYTHELIEKSKKVNISVLSQKADLSFIGNFGFQSGRNVNKLEKISYEEGNNKIPVITQNAVVAYETSVIDEIDVGTHTIFVLLLEATKKISDDEVLTYDYYHKVIKGKVPKTASTFVEENTSEDNLSNESDTLNDNLNNENNTSNDNLSNESNASNDKLNNESNASNSSNGEVYNKYQCTICGYIYDDAKEAVKFEDLPDDWVCPICQVPKSNFKKIN